MTVWSIKRNLFSFIIMFCYFSKMHVLLLKSLLPWWTNDIMRTETDSSGRHLSLSPPPPPWHCSPEQSGKNTPSSHGACCLSTVYRGWLTHRDFVWDTMNIWSVTAVQNAAGQWFDPHRSHFPRLSSRTITGLSIPTTSIMSSMQSPRFLYLIRILRTSGPDERRRIKVCGEERRRFFSHDSVLLCKWMR